VSVVNRTPAIRTPLAGFVVWSWSVPLQNPRVIGREHINREGSIGMRLKSSDESPAGAAETESPSLWTACILILQQPAAIGAGTRAQLLPIVAAPTRCCIGIIDLSRE